MIHRPSLLFAVLCSTACLLFASIPAIAEDEKLELLLNRTPQTPNTIGYVNVKSLDKLMSDAGMADGVVDNVGEYWFVSNLDLASLRPKWEAGYATLKAAADAEKLAATVKGYVDEVAGAEVVWSPGQTYFLPGKDNRLGILRPADRKLLAGWINPNMNIVTSRYLRGKSKPPESYLSLMVAVELKDVFSPVPLATKLETYKALKSQSADSVGRLLASIEGVSIIVGREGLSQCIITADFGKSPAALKPIATDLFSEMLERNGTGAAEILTWKTTVKGNSLSLQGPITEGTLAGLLSIFSVQSQADRAISASDESRQRSAQDQIAYRTKNYFDEVNEIIERTRKHKSQTTGALAKWNDQRARQIDEMGTLNIDPGMVQYGSDVADLLRGNALTVRQGNIAAGKTKASQTLSNDYGYYGGGYYGGGYYNSNSTTDYQNVTDAYARGNAYANYRQVLSEIDKRTVAVRRAMTDKFQIQF